MTDHMMNQAMECDPRLHPYSAPKRPRKKDMQIVVTVTAPMGVGATGILLAIYTLLSTAGLKVSLDPKRYLKTIPDGGAKALGYVREFKIPVRVRMRSP